MPYNMIQIPNTAQPNSRTILSHCTIPIQPISMDLFAMLFSVQGVFDTPEAELTPSSAAPIEAAIDGGSQSECVVA